MLTAVILLTAGSSQNTVSDTAGARRTGRKAMALPSRSIWASVQPQSPAALKGQPAEQGWDALLALTPSLNWLNSALRAAFTLPPLQLLCPAGLASKHPQGPPPLRLQPVPCAAAIILPGLLREDPHCPSLLCFYTTAGASLLQGKSDVG